MENFDRKIDKLLEIPQINQYFPLSKFFTVASYGISRRPKAAGLEILDSFLSTPQSLI